MLFSLDKNSTVIHNVTLIALFKMTFQPSNTDEFGKLILLIRDAPPSPSYTPTLSTVTLRHFQRKPQRLSYTPDTLHRIPSRLSLHLNTLHRLLTLSYPFWQFFVLHLWQSQNHFTWFNFSSQLLLKFKDVSDENQQFYGLKQRP